MGPSEAPPPHLPGWRRLELHLLEGAQLHVQPGQEQAGPDWLAVHQLDLGQLAEVRMLPACMRLLSSTAGRRWRGNTVSTCRWAWTTWCPQRAATHRAGRLSLLCPCAQAAVRLGGGRVRASLRRVAESIFHPQVLELRWGGGGDSGEDAGSGGGGGGNSGWA